MIEKEIHTIGNRKLQKNNDMICPDCHCYTIYADYLGEWCENCQKKIKAHKTKKWAGKASE